MGTQSEWGWDSYKNTNNYKFSETLRDYDQYGRKISYSVQEKSTPRKNEAVNWFRQNAHLLQLGNLGFEITEKDGTLAKAEDIESIDQTLNLWTGEIESSFKVEGVLGKSKNPFAPRKRCHWSKSRIRFSTTRALENSFANSLSNRTMG